MSIQSNRAQIDGSLNVDGSIYQWNELFIGGGGGGGGDVAWSSGDVGLNNEVITAVGDGSINAEQYLTFDNANGLKIKGGKDLKLLAATDSSDAGDIIWEYDDGVGEWARLWSSQPSGDLYYRNEPDGLVSRLIYHSGNLFLSGNTNNNLVTASGGNGIYGESWLTADFTTKLLSIDGSIYTTGDVSISGDLDVGGTLSYSSLTPLVYSIGGNTYYYKLGTLSGDGARVHIKIIGQNQYSSEYSNITEGVVSIGNADNEYGAWQYSYGNYSFAPNATIIYKDEGSDTSIDVYVQLGTYFKGSVQITEGWGFTLNSSPQTPVSNPSGVNATDGYDILSDVNINKDTSVNGHVNAADGFKTGNWEIVHNTTADTLDFNYIG